MYDGSGAFDGDNCDRCDGNRDGCYSDGRGNDDIAQVHSALHGVNNDHRNTLAYDDMTCASGDGRAHQY